VATVVSRVRVKICGITRLNDALLAVHQGADALGFVFYPDSPRAITAEQAQAIIRELPVFVTTVGLFVNATQDVVAREVAQSGVTCLQFHGEESAEYCESFSLPYIKAIRIKPGMDVAGSIAAYSGSSAILVDSWHPQQAGGTGEGFDWSVLQGLPEDTPPLVLAGGLHAANIAAAIQQVQPYAVDVSSGVEDSPGMKSGRKIREFIDEVNRVRQ
tara:strand:- start:4143 stop:4787 length:645 start_codon:yes stop_codon:yes gene_type:complete